MPTNNMGKISAIISLIIGCVSILQCVVFFGSWFGLPGAGSIVDMGKNIFAGQVIIYMILFLGIPFLGIVTGTIGSGSIGIGRYAKVSAIISSIILALFLSVVFFQINV